MAPSSTRKTRPPIRNVRRSDSFLQRILAEIRGTDDFSSRSMNTSRTPPASAASGRRASSVWVGGGTIARDARDRLRIADEAHLSRPSSLGAGGRLDGQEPVHISPACPRPTVGGLRLPSSYSNTEYYQTSVSSAGGRPDDHELRYKPPTCPRPPLDGSGLPSSYPHTEHAESGYTLTRTEPGNASTRADPPFLFCDIYSDVSSTPSPTEAPTSAPTVAMTEATTASDGVQSVQQAPSAYTPYTYAPHTHDTQSEYLIKRLTSRNPRPQVDTTTPNLNPTTVPSYHDRRDTRHPLPHGRSFVDATHPSHLPDTPPESPPPSSLPTPSHPRPHPPCLILPKPSTPSHSSPSPSPSPPLSPGPPPWTQPLHLMDTASGLSIYSHIHGDDERTNTFCVYCFRVKGRWEKMDGWGRCGLCGRGEELEGVFWVERGEGC
ncbi:hypothetical protein IQ07DRAFT_684598 [Pyrenochaeta sp. DS3sAY3a]|nr:hypothetical protein IQ07DRAFT_684598 [Pyrenochaeta sp. DS3sAY3a]